MKFKGFLVALIILGSFAFMTSKPAFAEDDASGNYSESTDKGWDFNSFNNFFKEYFNNVKISIQNIQNHINGVTANGDNSGQVVAYQQINLRDQQIQLYDLRDQQDMQKQIQQDRMQNLTDLTRRQFSNL